MFLFKSVCDTHLYFRLFSSGHKPIVQAYFYLIFSQVLQPPKVRRLYMLALCMCACWHDRFWIASCSLQSFAPNQGASASILTYWDPWPARRLVTVVIAQISRVLHGKAVLPLIYFACRNHTQHRLHTNGSTQSLPPSVTRLSWWWYGLEKRLATTRDNHGSEERLHIQWQVIRVTE
jgi:hypothetical protein